MADWNDIKRAFEREANKAEEAHVQNEQNLLKSIADYICSQKGISTIQGYKPEDILAFLEKPIPEIKECIGGNWLNISDSDLETLIFTLTKKVKKSDSMMQW